MTVGTRQLLARAKEKRSVASAVSLGGDQNGEDGESGSGLPQRVELRGHRGLIDGLLDDGLLGGLPDIFQIGLLDGPLARPLRLRRRENRNSEK